MKFKNIKLGYIIIASSLLLATGCDDSATKSEVSSTAKSEVPSAKVQANTISEESLGLRKTDIYSESTETHGDETKYGKGYAGGGYKIKRAFQDAPPMIPHDIDGMLPITINNNQCIDCHMPEVAASMNATPVPSSHFTNFRPQSSYALKGQNTSDVKMANVSIVKEEKLVGARFGCTQCHAPQSTGKLAVENTFEAVYTDKDGADKSSWSGTKLMEGLDTKNSK